MQLTGNLLKLLQSNEDEKTVQVLQKYYRAAYPVMLHSNRIDDFLATISRTCSALQDNSAPLNLKEAKDVVIEVLIELLKMIKPEQNLEITKGKVTIEDKKMEKKLKIRLNLSCAPQPLWVRDSLVARRESLVEAGRLCRLLPLKISSSFRIKRSVFASSLFSKLVFV